MIRMCEVDSIPAENRRIKQISKLFHMAFCERMVLTMKKHSPFGVLLASVGILLAVCTAITYLLYKFSRDKAYDEKWEDYIDCGVS